MDDFQALLDTPFKLIGSLLLGLLLYYIKKDKEDLNARLDKIENKLSQVEDHIDAKIEFVVDKIMNITPEKESTNIKINQNSDRIITIEKAIGALSQKLNNTGAIHRKDLDSFAMGYKKDMEDFKKIMFTLRDEINQLIMENKKDGT